MASQLPDDLNKQKGENSERSLFVSEENSERSLKELCPNDLNDMTRAQ